MFQWASSRWLGSSQRHGYDLHVQQCLAFDQDLGWCLDDDVDLCNQYGSCAFDDTKCASTSCGVVQKACPAGTCAPTPAPTPAPVSGLQSDGAAPKAGAGAAAALLVAALL